MVCYYPQAAALKDLEAVGGGACRLEKIFLNKLKKNAPGLFIVLILLKKFQSCTFIDAHFFKTWYAVHF